MLTMTATRLPMKPHGTKGTLITFCGLDGSGKTTLINYVKSRLEKEGHKNPIVLVKQPTDFVRNLPIFRAFSDSNGYEKYDYRSLSVLCASDRIQHCNRVIKPLLEQGCTVISDRYYFSCLANLWARGYHDEQWIIELAEHIQKPDAAFFLEISAETAAARVHMRPDEAECRIDDELQRRLQYAFSAIAAANDGITVGTSGETSESCEIVFERIKQILENKEEDLYEYQCYKKNMSVGTEKQPE